MDRSAREDKAVTVCHGCHYEMGCLEFALVFSEEHGVWGGMKEGERRRFVQHLKDEGYDEIPRKDELWASLRTFYLSEGRPEVYTIRRGGRRAG